MNLCYWNKLCELQLNKQINLEYWASYQYHLIWSYFDRDSVALMNVAEFFKKSSLEERDHAHKFMEYQNMRGGIVEFYPIENINLDYLTSPSNVQRNDVLLSFEKALDMENKVYDSLLNLHKTADSCSDPQFADFIEGEYLKEQVESINEIKKYISQLKRIGEDGHGIWNFNNNLKE